MWDRVGASNPTLGAAGAQGRPNCSAVSFAAAQRTASDKLWDAKRAHERNHTETSIISHRNRPTAHLQRGELRGGPEDRQRIAGQLRVIYDLWGFKFWNV